MGHRITRAASHLLVDEVKERMKTERRPWVRQHWWIIYNALVAPRKAEEIAFHTGVSTTTVHRVIARYNHLEPSAIEQFEKGGRRHEYLSIEQEQAFLLHLWISTLVDRIVSTLNTYTAERDSTIFLPLYV